MLEPVADAIKAEHGHRAEVHTLPYMARAFDNGYTYADSKVDAIERSEQTLSKVADSCPSTKFTITGFSQGADAAGDLASAIGNGSGPVDAGRVLAVGLLADPGAGTMGAATVGPRTSGTGIADPRPQGMGALAGRVASICGPGDLYCSIDKGSSPILGSLGSILSTSLSALTAGDTAGANTHIATALTSSFANADLPGLGTDVATLGAQLTAPNVDIREVAATATSIAKTIAPLADLFDSGAAHPAVTGQLAAAPVGTAERNASDVLVKAGASHLASVLDTVTRLADTAKKLSRDESLRLPPTAPEVQNLAAAADAIGAQLAPVVSTPSDALASASNVLSVLKPNMVVNQILAVTTGVASLDMPGILDNLNLLQQKIIAADARGAHQIAGELNNQFSPLVKMAAEVDLTWVSQVLAIIPDPSGTAQVASLVASILSHVDIIRLANIVGQIQELAWAAIEKLMPPAGQLPDPIAAAAAMSGLLPLGADLASVAVNMLSGTATNTPPELLGKQSPAVPTGITTQATNLDLPALSPSLAKLAGSQGLDDLAALVREGLNAASFLHSGTHTGYNNLVVDNGGRSAIQWLSDWLNLQIKSAV